MSANKYFEDVCQLFSTSSSREANDYLNLGWILLNVESIQHSEHGWNTGFVLGWKKSSGEVKQPPARPNPWITGASEGELSAPPPF